MCLLVLLSSEVMAAKLDFNYTIPDTLSLEPRLGFQARACHSKADPMDIMFRANKGIYITKPYKVMLSISGGAYPKSYSVFSSSAKSGMDINSDFLVPWRAYAKGASHINEMTYKYRPEVPAENSDPFCFSNDGPKYHLGILLPNAPDPSLTLLPIFKDKPYYSDPLGSLTGNDFEKKCKSTFDWLKINNPNVLNSISYYWPSDERHHLIHYSKIQGVTGSNHIEESAKNYGISGLVIENKGNIYFAKRTEGQPASTVESNIQRVDALDENCTTSTCDFTFLNGEGKDGNYLMDDGSFSVKLNNRNVTSLTLTLVYDKITYTWNWQRDSSSLTSNILSLVNSTEGRGTVLPTSIEADDPYKSFYKNGAPSFYRGTLVANGSLNMDSYNYYINNVIPLSLPSNKAGDINLVNTEGLTFSLGVGSNGAPTLGVLGQPLKFAPLTVNGKEAASAMQVRDACY